ncbi:MAG: hypothetical protein P8J51_02620 [Dehalococcoidia bacterium]|nr:hypothetical protein [Dehalococcoidia bacterium]
MNCKKCSSPIDSKSTFCSKCGSKQDSQLTPATEQQTKKRSKLVPTLIGIVVIAAVVGVSFFLYQQESLGKSCTLTNGEIVEDDWRGKGAGNNYCNNCFCSNGMLGCTEMACSPLEEVAGAAEVEFDRRSLEVDNYFKEAT